MIELIRERLSGWGTRLSFGALLLVFSEWVVWQKPTTYSALDWLALAAIYLALAAAALDLMSRLNIGDFPGLLLLAGLYGLVNGTLVSHIIARDLPSSLLVRPLAAQPLAFLGAFASFRILASGRATGPLEFLIALVSGLVWGVWVRWFPTASQQALPQAEIETALSALAPLLLGCGVLRSVLPPAAIYTNDDWQLVRAEWVVVGAALLAALGVGGVQGTINDLALVLCLTLSSMIGMMLYMIWTLRRGVSLLAPLTPPRRPNIAAWMVLLPPFLLAGWIGYRLGGGGGDSRLGDILFALLAVAGVIWPPTISVIIGMRAFISLARKQG